MNNDMHMKNYSDWLINNDWNTYGAMETMHDLIWAYGTMGIITMGSKVGMALNIDDL